MSPQRLQLSRREGWRLPAQARSVARPGRWGNPHRIIKDTSHPDTQWVVASGRDTEHGRYPTVDQARAKAVELYREWASQRRAVIRAARTELGGRDLACWCPIGAPCHAEVLLDIANPDPS